MTIPKGFRKKAPKVCTLHKGNVERQEMELQEGFRITTPFRTLQDLSKAAGERERWSEAVKDAARRGLISLAQEKILKDGIH